MRMRMPRQTGHSSSASSSDLSSSGRLHSSSFFLYNTKHLLCQNLDFTLYKVKQRFSWINFVVFFLTVLSWGRCIQSSSCPGPPSLASHPPPSPGVRLSPAHRDSTTGYNVHWIFFFSSQLAHLLHLDKEWRKENGGVAQRARLLLLRIPFLPLMDTSFPLPNLLYTLLFSSFLPQKPHLITFLLGASFVYPWNTLIIKK